MTDKPILKAPFPRGRWRSPWSNPWAHLFFCLVALFVAVVSLNRSQPSRPAIASLLDPFQGVWRHKKSIWEDAKASSTLTLSGLKRPVKVVVDSDQIKHVFAENDEDLYFAQGYIIASERLWEMEFLSRVAGGRLSEIMGRTTLDLDRHFVKMGLPQAAKESGELMLADPVTAVPLNAYAAGVNAFIKTLAPDTYPFEYKLLGLAPEPWQPLYAAHLLKFMAYDLSGRNREIMLSRSRSRISKDDFENLFPLALDVPEPIVPKGTKFNFPSRAPAAPTTEFLADLKPVAAGPEPHPGNGSNNWAVAGKKSTTGKPILSNDIHLSLTLPSLWYEMQLVSPTQNVYGASLPGAPGVILGFNAKLAWGVTNAGSDVLDWYQLRFRDQNRSEYLFDDTWRPVISREVQIKVRGEDPVTELLRQTHLGPLVYDQSEAASLSLPNGLAMRWSALDASNELKTFLSLNRAKSTSHCREALENFQAPAQNFVCADQAGDVGLWHMGRFPVRWRGQGRLISDGSSSHYEWHGWLPRTEVPSSRNPERGFVSSANQQPADENYPHYLGWPFESPFRAIRINEILREKRKFSPEDMMAMQGDTVSVLARTALPLLLTAVETSAARSQLDANLKDALTELKAWDYRYTETSVAASVFEAWFQAFERRLWAPHFPDRHDYQFPPLVRTLRLMKEDPNSKWFDDPNTPQTEHFNDIAITALHEAVSETQGKLGKLSKWSWSTFQPTEFSHISRIPGLGSRKISAPGVSEAIFANYGNHGPVWKMVVALGAKPKGWSIFPGGQSGDPASSHYDDFLEPWRQNSLKEIVYLLSPGDRDPRSERTFTFEATDNR